MAQKQKIAFLCHPYHRGGVTRWMADAAIAFDKKGLEVYFVTVDPIKEFYSAHGRETLLQLLAKVPNNIQAITAKTGYEFEFGTPEYRAFIYRQLLAQLPPGTPIILSDDYVVWASAIAMQSCFPIVGVLHADEEQYYGVAEEFHKQVDIYVCVSNRVQNLVKYRIPGFDPKHLFVIPCGINMPEIDYNTEHNDILQLVYAGRVNTYQKRAADLARIAVMLAEKQVKFHLRIIGDGDAKAELEQAVKTGGLSDAVTFFGWLTQEQVAKHLSESDILLLTSDFEGTPIAMMEAFAAGCGMVGTRVSGIEDYEQHPLAEDCLYVYAAGYIEEAVAKIIRLAEVPKSTRQHSARLLAETEFSMDVCLEKYLHAISTITPRTDTRLPEIKLSLAARMYSKTLAMARNLKTGHANS